MDRTYSYDANGNITYIDGAEVSGSVTAGIYSYDQGTNLLADIWREVPVVYGYDENGNTVSANNRTFTYDLSNRLIMVQDDGVTIAQYVYNALNQRIKKILPTGTRIFHYDLSGHLIAETNETGQMLAEYIDLGDQPLAMIRPSETLYYYHNDHLGTPQILTDDTGTISWKAVYTPFGEAVISVELVENPFRFPGQYYDQETGLHYNWNRYYDPKTGRYLTPDPIGLEGGINLFAFAQNNPVNSFDVNGRESSTPTDRRNCMKHPIDCISVMKCRDKASQETIKNYGHQGHNDEADAFRHCYWSCCMTQTIGASQAKIFGDGHEDDPTQPACEKYMDLYNNWVGIQLGTGNPNSDCGAMCKGAALVKAPEQCCPRK